MMKVWLIFSSAVILSGCAGDFCDVYQEPALNDEAATALVQMDREGAQTIAANKVYAETYCKE